MQVVVKKSALMNLLEMIAEGRTGDTLDMMDKFIDDKEPIAPVEMAATQLAFKKPNVSDPEYMPATLDELGEASLVIANEVPHSQIEFYYRKLHELLDDALDRSEDLGFDYDLSEINENRVTSILRQIIRESDAPKKPRRIIVRKDSTGATQTRDFGDLSAQTVKAPSPVRVDMSNVSQEEMDYVEGEEEEAKLDALAGSMNDFDVLANSLVSKYNDIVKNYIETSKTTFKKSELDSLIQQNPYVLGTFRVQGEYKPTNENERFQVFRPVIDELIAEDPVANATFQKQVQLLGKGNSRAGTLGVYHQLMKRLAAMPEFITLKGKGEIPSSDIIQMEANRVFDQMIKGAGQKSRTDAVKDDSVFDQIDAIMKEYVANLKSGEPEIILQGQTFSVDDLINELIAISDEYKKSKQSAKNLAADIEKEKRKLPKDQQGLPDLDIEEIEKETGEVELELKQSGKWTDMAPWFEFSGESGIRQWYLKHVASKFEMLMKGGQAGEANPGAKAFREGYSNSILYIIDKLIDYIPGYVKKKTKEGSEEAMKYAKTAQDALQDIEKIQELAIPLDNILDVEGDMESDQLTDMLANSIGGNIISNVNSEKFKKVTTFLMDKVGPDLAKSAYQDEAGIKDPSSAFIEAVTGKSEPPDFSNPDKSKAKKMIAAGVTPEVFSRVLKDYQKELDMYLKTAFDKGGELFNIIEKSDEIKDKDLQGAFDEYVVSRYRQSKEEDIGKELQEIYRLIKKII